MSAEKLSEAAQTLAVPVVHARLAFVEILTLVEASFLPHESIRIFSKLLANRRMSLQVLLQRGMLLDKLLVFDQRRIFVKLFRDFRMAVQKPIRTREFPTSRVVVADAGSFIAITVPYASPLVTVAIPDTSSLVAVADSPITLFLAAVEPFFAVHESVRILAELFANFWMSLQE